MVEQFEEEDEKTKEPKAKGLKCYPHLSPRGQLPVIKMKIKPEHASMFELTPEIQDSGDVKGLEEIDMD